MGLTAGVQRRLARFGYAAPAVLLVAVPGGTATRLAVERLLRERGWPEAQSPAAADVVAICGRPGPELAAAVDQLWRQVPAPRARLELTAPGEVPARLDQAAARLRALERAVVRRPPSARTTAELAMADLAEDRDGLTLDRVEARLGPVLPGWPPGLVLDVALQGDVIQAASARWLDGGRDATGHDERDFWVERLPALEAGRRAAARDLDRAARLLLVAGWDGAALSVRHCRDDLLGSASTSELRRRMSRLAARTGGSLLLSAMLGSVGPPGDSAGARLRGWFSAALRALDVVPVPQPAAPELDADRLVGAELATARLRLAALDPGIPQAVAHA